MKNLRIKISCVVLLVLGSIFSSCDKGFEEVNTDPIGKGTTTPDQLLAPALVNVLAANMSRNRSFNNELMQVTVDISDADGKVFRYDFRRNWSDYLWNIWYPELTNLKDIERIASAPETLNKSYQGVSIVSQAWVYSLLTDTYGDVPYSQANEGRSGIIEPKYDKQQDIYTDLFARLETANTLLSGGESIVATGDPVYSGNVSRWRKLGNSLYLRFLLRVSKKAETSAAAIAKIKEIVANPAKYPIMMNNDDTAKILWNGTNSSSAVYSSPYMIGVRPVDFRSPAITSFFINNLKSNPVIDATLGKNSIPRWGIIQGAGGYVGIPSGFGTGSGVTRQAYFGSEERAAPTGTGYSLQTDPYTGILMNAAEVYFILAEAAAKGWIETPQKAELYYNQGMLYTINYWLPNWSTVKDPNVNPITDPKFLKYITDQDIDYDPSLPLDAATGPSRMEQIHIQKYYALFLVDLQQWFEYRRTGHPILPKGAGLANGGVMPARIQYPIISQSSNPSAYKNAVAQQGPDEIFTQVWWQKP